MAPDRMISPARRAAGLIRDCRSTAVHRPLFSAADASSCEVVVGGNRSGDGDDVDAGTADQVVRVTEAAPHSQRVGDPVGGSLVPGGDGREGETVRCLYGRHVRFPSPAHVAADPDDAYVQVGHVAPVVLDYFRTLRTSKLSPHRRLCKLIVQ